MLPDGSFKSWKNEWNDFGYEVELEKLLIPIYPKIRLPFLRIYIEYLKIKEHLSDVLSEYDVELHLTTINKYKNFLIANPIKDKLEILTKSLPRFLWIVRLFHKNQLIGDQVYDGTSVYIKSVISVKFELES